ncbi:MAG: fumarylacetoacetate hydrolase family protein [Pseudomonadota bacterium]
MADYVFAPPAPPSVAIAGSDQRFPVRRIFCVGRNYAEHTREMGFDPDREPPFFFGKPPSEIAHDGEEIAFPPETSDLHYEGEMVVALGSGGRDIAQDDALSHVWGYGVANDLTRRDVQGVAKKMGRPWDWGKGFDKSAVIGPIHPVAATGHIDKGYVRSWVNGQLRQDGDVAQMIWSLPEIISFISHSMRLAAGDLILTGTPAGVGKLEPGDEIKVSVEGLGDLTNTLR